MRDILSEIRKPVEAELEKFDSMFQESLNHADGRLRQVLQFMLQRTGKRMRPMLSLLIAKNFGTVCEATYHAAIGLELLHTASLVHDDVVDEADKRRGQDSVNAFYGNSMAVLVGDYILSTALMNVAQTKDTDIVCSLSKLGMTLANGEILQLTSNGSETISEDDYYSVIQQKTAALFEACCVMGAMSVGASEDDIQTSRLFGQKVGMIFQVRDDIFDYYDSEKIGKPTGNDMREGKLTLPVIHALLTSQDDDMYVVAQRVKARQASVDDITRLIAFAKDHGGIEYAEDKMRQLHTEASYFIKNKVSNDAIRNSLTAYLDYCVERSL